MSYGWKRWFDWQFAEAKKYLDLTDPTRRNPPFIVVAGGCALLFVLACLIWG